MSRDGKEALPAGPRTFAIVVALSEEGCIEIRLRGEVDAASAGRLDRGLEQAAVSGRRVLLDLAECELLDSTVLAVLVGWHRRLEREGQGLGAYRPSGQVRRVLKLTGLFAAGLAFDTREEAIAASAAPELI